MAGREARGRCSTRPVCRRARRRSSATRSTTSRPASRPTSASTGATAMVAVAMNGEPLPATHGFPGAPRRRRAVRLRVGHQVAGRDRAHDVGGPRRLLDRPRVVQGGARAQDGGRRIDVPSGSVAAGDITVAGVVRVPRPSPSCGSTTATGPNANWRPRAGASDETWLQWRHAWTATPGSHRLQVRATDGDGETQTMEAAPPAPLTECRGKYHTRSVQVD